MELKKQRGMAMISWLVVMVVLGFFALVLIRLLPVYVDDYGVKNVIKSLSEDSALIAQNQSADSMVTAVKTSLAKRFVVNNIKNISVHDVEVSSTTQGIEVHLEYESRVPILFNIDAVVHFEHTEVVPVQ